jgi:arsenate reductase-like glutaredoxin family protein
MIAFINLWETLLAAVTNFAVSELKNFPDQTITDIVKFLENAKGDIERWVIQYAEGKLTADELKWLIKGSKDLAELLFLKEKEFTKEQLNHILNNLVEVIVSAVLKAI